MRRAPEGLVLALVGALAAWAAGCSWAPMFAAPHRFLVPGAVLALLVTLIGWAGRSRGVHVAAILGAQLVTGYVVLALWFSPAAGHRAVGDLGDLPAALVHGARQINTYASPAPARFVDVAIFLSACLALLALGIDLVAGTLRRGPLAGLLLLLAVTVPISVLVERVHPWVFVLIGAAYLALVALAQRREVRAWGRHVVAPTSGTRAHVPPATVIGAGCLAVALLASGVLPVSHGIFGGGDDGHGGGGTRGVTLANPLIDLRRDLVQMSHTPLMEVRTDDPDPSYVQLSVLDQFTGSQWRAANRKLPESNRLPGVLPPAPGIGQSQPGTDTTWSITLAPTFKTSWLPVPVPATSVDVHGDWRYDARTLDIVDTAGELTDGSLHYTVNAFHPDYDANVLNNAGVPVGQVIDGMTVLPANMPAVILRTARRVTHGADTEYEQLARLQDWFRKSGGFHYSTQPAPGSGMALLATFITTDKVGYCEQFAAAMAVMGRSLGIPSRVVVGFLRPTGHAAERGDVEFTSDDLHAWPQFYFAGSGWITFDPTPGTRTGGAPAYTEQALRPRGNEPTAPASPRATQRTAPAKPAKLPDHERAQKPGGGNGAWWLLLVPIVVGAAVTPRALRSRQRTRRLNAEPGVTPAAALAAGCWAELRATSRDLGIGWADGRSPRQSFAVLRSRVTADVDLADDLEWLCTFIERSWYAPPAPVTSADAEHARQIVLTWRVAMREIVPESRARRERWRPPSLLERQPAPEAEIGRDVSVPVR